MMLTHRTKAPSPIEMHVCIIVVFCFITFFWSYANIALLYFYYYTCITMVSFNINVFKEYCMDIICSANDIQHFTIDY